MWALLYSALCSTLQYPVYIACMGELLRNIKISKYTHKQISQSPWKEGRKEGRKKEAKEGRASIPSHRWPDFSTPCLVHTVPRPRKRRACCACIPIFGSNMCLHAWSTVFFFLGEKVRRRAQVLALANEEMRAKRKVNAEQWHENEDRQRMGGFCPWYVYALPSLLFISTVTSPVSCSANQIRQRREQSARLACLDHVQLQTDGQTKQKS